MVQQVQGLCGGQFHRQQTQCAEQWWLESTLRWGEEQGRSLHMYTGTEATPMLDTGLGHVCAHSEGTLMAVLRAR